MKKPFSKQTQNKDNPTKLENNPNKRGITHFNNSILKTPNTREILFIPNEPENLNLNTNRDRENLIIYKPFEIPPEWPSDEELQEKAELFSDKDNHKIFFPTSLESSFQSKIKWLRPDEYVRNFLIQKEIKINFPNKNQTKMLREIIDYYYTVELILRKIKTEKEQNLNKNFSSLNSQNKKGETSNLDDSTYTEYKDIILNTVDSEILNGFNDFNTQAYNDTSKANIYNNKFDERNIIINEGKESFNLKRNIYKIFFKFFENKPKIFLVNLSERNETVFETKQRLLIIQQEEENNRAELLNKNKKNLNSRISNKNLNQNIYKENNLPTNKNISQDPIKIKNIDPSDLYFTNDQNIPVFTKWLTSIFQIINDLNLTDAYTNRSILSNIYPQRENIPIISATGRYWVKLYFMGKPRKIEIDDTIPCNRNECYVFPRCDDIGEIWPALFTKALLKLYSYKYSHFYYKEIADLSYIYSLLGYYTEKIPINSPRVKIMENILLNPMEVIDDKILTFSCMNLIEENLKIPIIPNAQEFSKKSFNFNFKILDQEKDSIYNNTNNDTSNIVKFSNSINRKFSIKPKTNLNFHDYISNKTIKPKFSSIVKNIFSGYKNKQPRANSVSKNLLEFPSTGGGQKNIGNILSSEKNIMQILAAGASQGLNNINSFDKENLLREIITNEDRKDTNNIDESEINFNVGEKGKKNDTIDSENPHNNNTSNQNLILNQISENDVIHECYNEHGLNSKVLIPDKKNKYIDFVSKLKTFNIIKNKTHKTKSSNDLKLFDFSNTETVFKIQENKPNDVHKLHELLNQRIIKSFARNDNTVKTSTNLVKFDPSMESLGKNDNIKRDDILVNFIYSILEIFDNKKYNMLRLKQVDFSDLKKIVREAQPPGVYKRLSGEEKKIYLSNVLEIKNKQIEYKNQRIEDLKKEGKQFSLIKIKNCCKGIPKFEFYIPYTDYEIFITRKCILNNWALPPPVFYKKEHFLGSEKFEKKEFEEIQINVDENINLEGKKENTNILINLVNNTQNILKSSVFPKKEINKNKLNIGLCKIDEKPESNINNPSLSNINIPFSDNSVMLPNTNRSFLNKKKKNTSYENIHDLLNDKTQYLDSAKEPLSKYTGGQWLNYLDFKKFFNTCIFFYNPKKFKNILILDNNWIYNLDCYEIKQDFSVMYLTYDNINTKSLNASYSVNNTKSSLMLIFEPNNGKSENPIEINFYLNFDLIESSTGIKIQENIKFDEFFSVFYLNNLENDKNYFLMLKSFICPFGFNFTILSDHNVDCMSFNLYMKKFCKYDSQKFELEHKVIEKNKNLLLAKFSLKIEENTRMKVNIYHPDKLLMNYFDVFLVFGRNNKKKKIFFNNSEFFSIDPLKEEDLYYMIILANPPFIMNENNFTVEFLYNVENIKIENIEFIEPFKLQDRFSMNKYGIIFKENVTCSELVYTTLDISIKKSLEENLINSNKNLNNFIQHTQQSENKSIYSGDGGGKGNDQETHEKFQEENLLSQINPYQNDQENFTEKIRMKIKILKNKKILFEEDFFNHILIDNFIFENPYYNSMNFTPDPKNKTTSPILPDKEAYTYTIICYFEQSELEKNREFIVNPFWEIRFFASDFLYFSKDTSKEDFEASIKDSWEINNPGRSDLAKTSRLRFLVSKKIQEGKKLNKQEEEIIKQERIRKTSYSTEIIFPREKIILNNIKQKIPANEKKNLNDIQETMNILPKIEKIEFNKPIIIKPEFIKSLYIKNFVNYTLKDRTIVKGNDVSETQRLILTDNLRQRKIEEINHKFSNYEYYKKTDTEEIDNFNVTSTENLKKFYRTTTNFRMYTRDSSNNLFKQRDCLRGKIQQKNEYEKNIIDILLSSNNDLNYCTIIFNETQGQVGISTRLRDKLFNHISVKKDDFYKNEIKKLTVKDKGLASRYLDEINNENWNISADVIHKLQDLVEGETHINPKK